MSSPVSPVAEELLYLYELALTVGRSLSFDDNCRSFLQVLQRRKDIAFGAIWLYDYSANEPVASLAHALPGANRGLGQVGLSHPMVSAARQAQGASVLHTDPEYVGYATEEGLGPGTYAIMPLGDLGFLKLFSHRDTRFSRRDLGQLRAVVDRLSIALKASLEHAELQRAYAERLRAETALQSNEARFRDFVESAADWFWETDAAGRITYVSENFDRITGLDEEHVLGGPLEVGWLLAAKHTAAREDFVQRIEERRPIEGLELRWKGGDGQERVHRFSGKPVLRAGRFIGFRGSATDISERAMAQARQEQLEAQLAQSQKMEAVGQLTGGIAHDFNNILGTVLGFAELARDIVDPADEQMDRYIEEIQGAGERARNLVAQMLTYSRGGTGPIENVEVGPILTEATRLLRSTLPSTIQVSLNALADEVAVRSDNVSLQQVLMNLCINSRDAMPGQKGVIDITLSRRSGRLGHCDSCHGVIEGDWVVLTVRDDGRGIPDDAKARMFEPFYSTKPVGKGTGMGLPMVHGIVHRHEGHVRVDTAPGKGTEIRIFWPEVSEPSRVSAPDAARAASTYVGQGEQILIVDDEASVGRVLSEMLERAGYRTVVTTRPDDALAWVRRAPSRFELLITDQTMPGMTGTELIAAIRGVCPALPALLCSGYSDVDADAVGERAGLLRKPITAEELHGAVSHLLGSDPAGAEGAALPH